MASFGLYECHLCGAHYTRGANLTNHLEKKHEFRLPAGHKRHAVATCMLLVASLCFLIMADSIYVVCVTILLFS